MAWQVDAQPSMQPVVFPETTELIINDFRDGDDQLTVVDIRSDEVISRVSTGSRLANGMFLIAGSDRDVYYCSTFVISRVRRYWSTGCQGTRCCRCPGRLERSSCRAAGRTRRSNS